MVPEYGRKFRLSCIHSRNKSEALSSHLTIAVWPFDLYTEALTTQLCILRPPNLRPGTRNAGSDLFLVKRVTSIHHRNVLVSVIPV